MRVFVNGTFEILHRGHLELLRYAKSLGYVIVGIDTDECIKEKKGPTRPIHNQALRPKEPGEGRRIPKEPWPADARTTPPTA